jgi:uncharacterized protein (DUF58 family)
METNQNSAIPLFDEAFMRKLERLAVMSRRAVTGQMQGERRSPKRGQSVEFADFRPYSMGDDFRRIDWNAYARLERFFIKLFVEEEDLTVHILIDSSKSMDWGEPNKLQYAIRTAGALGYIAMVGLDRVTVKSLSSVTNGAYYRPTRGKQNAFGLFSFLQTITAYGSARLAPSLKNYAATALQQGPLLLLSDLMDDGWADGLRALAGRGFEVSVIHILSPDEVEPTISGDLKLLDSETRTPVEITAEFDLIERYKAGLADWQSEIHQFCAVRGINYAPVTTSLPFEELIFAWLRRQGIIK